MGHVRSDARCLLPTPARFAGGPFGPRPRLSAGPPDTYDFGVPADAPVPKRGQIGGVARSEAPCRLRYWRRWGAGTGGGGSVRAVPSAADSGVEDGIVAVLRTAGAAFGYVHGSRADGPARPASDLDVAAWWPDDAPAPWDVDLGSGVDLLVLNGAPLELAGRVAAGGRLLFEDDPAARVRWEASTRKLWFDEQPRIDRARSEALAAMRARG